MKIKRGTNGGTKKNAEVTSTRTSSDGQVREDPGGATAVIVEDFRESTERRVGKQKRGDCSDEGEPCKAVCYSLVLLIVILFYFCF